MPEQRDAHPDTDYFVSPSDVADPPEADHDDPAEFVPGFDSGYAEFAAVDDEGPDDAKRILAAIDAQLAGLKRPRRRRIIPTRKR